MKTIEGKSMLAAYTVGERRPMFTRDWKLSLRATHWLAKRHVAPNAISMVGMAGGAAAGLALAATARPGFERVGFLLTVAGIIIRGMGNLLDGMVAVACGKASRVGELFNEVPDRVADVAILVGAGYALGSSPVFGYWAAILAVLIAYVRAEGTVAGAPQVYCGPMAKPQRMVLILALSLYCGLTPASWQPVVSVGARELGLMGMGLTVIIGGGIWTVLRRLKRISRAVQSPAESLR